MCDNLYFLREFWETGFSSIQDWDTGPTPDGTWLADEIKILPEEE